MGLLETAEIESDYCTWAVVDKVILTCVFFLFFAFLHCINDCIFFFFIVTWKWQDEREKAAAVDAARASSFSSPSGGGGGIGPMVSRGGGGGGEDGDSLISKRMPYCMAMLVLLAIVYVLARWDIFFCMFCFFVFLAFAFLRVRCVVLLNWTTRFCLFLRVDGNVNSVGITRDRVHEKRNPKVWVLSDLTFVIHDKLP